MTMADRIGVMSVGVLIQLGTPRDILRAAEEAPMSLAGSARLPSIPFRQSS